MILAFTCLLFLSIFLILLFSGDKNFSEKYDPKGCCGSNKYWRYFRSVKYDEQDDEDYTEFVESLNSHKSSEGKRGIGIDDHEHNNNLAQF